MKTIFGLCTFSICLDSYLCSDLSVLSTSSSAYSSRSRLQKRRACLPLWPYTSDRGEGIGCGCSALRPSQHICGCYYLAYKACLIICPPEACVVAPLLCLTALDILSAVCWGELSFFPLDLFTFCVGSIFWQCPKDVCVSSRFKELPRILSTSFSPLPGPLRCVRRVLSRFCGAPSGWIQTSTAGSWT